MKYANYLILIGSILLFLVTTGFGQDKTVQAVNQFVLVLSIIVMGLSLGSFATALIYRLPRGLPFSTDRAGRPVRSVCPPCSRILTAWELIPLVSWGIQCGKCRCGKQNIPIFYPLVELGTLAYTWLVYFMNGFDIVSLPRYAAVPFVLAVLVLAFQGHSLSRTAGRVLTGVAGLLFATTIVAALIQGGFDWAEMGRRFVLILAFGAGATYVVRSVFPDLGRPFVRQAELGWLGAGVALISLLCPAPILFVFALAGAAAFVADARGLSQDRPIFPMALATCYGVALLCPAFF